MAGLTVVGQDTTIALAAPIERVRYDVRARRLTVVHVEPVTPAMLRITFGGDDLIDFDSRSFDDHLKLLLPQLGGQVERRDYTPRRFNRDARTLAIDFSLHDAGPATSWARRARPGDRLDIAGPKGSRVILPSVRRWLLIGDETALPAIGRKFEEVAPGDEVTSLVAVVGVEEQQAFLTAGSATVRWVHRPSAAAADPTLLAVALDCLTIEPRTFVWIAAEGTVAHILRERVIARGQPPGWLKAGGYWIAGSADAHLKLD